MSKREVIEYRRAGAAQQLLARPWTNRWYGQLSLLLLSVILLTLAFAPVEQFYLAWFGLAPWLLVLRTHRSQLAAFCWSWLAGSLFFIANMWWLANVSIPGMVALVLYLGLYWGVAAMLIRGLGLLDCGGQTRMSAPAGRQECLPQQADKNVCPKQTGMSAPPSERSMAHQAPAVYSIFLIAVIWTGCEWVRGKLFTGLPWLYMGHTQTPILAMCQIADVLGVYGVSFWVVMVNALLALLIVERVRFALLIGATALTAGLLIAILGYGIFRFAQSRHTLSAGPKVLVVQPNYPQDNSGSKGAPQEDIVRFHVEATRSALAKNPDVDLVVWSETMMPPVNAEAREIMRGSSEGKLLEDAHQQIASIAFEHHCAVLAGGLYLGDWREKGKDIVPFDRRNTAFFYNRAGMLSDIRYDKIHLVPFGEFIPFKYIPPAYQFFEWLSPYGNDDYTLTAGGDDALTVYTLEPNPTVTTRQQRSSAAPWRFVAPICFEDIDSGLVARMFRGGTSSFRNSGKKADFIVNITNDGWFMANEMPQHLQAAVFRSIENRAPTARSVNTGISGFIDPMGRTNGLIPSGQEGTSVRTLTLDRRLAPYTRIGDAFAIACTIIAAGVAVMLPWRACRRRKIEGNK